MKFSESWLCEWINNLSLENTVIKKWVMYGLEINSVEPILNKFENVIIGEIVASEKNKNTLLNTVKYLITINVGKNKKKIFKVGYHKSCQVNNKVAIAILDEHFFKKKIHNDHIKPTLSFKMKICSYNDLQIKNFKKSANTFQISNHAIVGSNIINYLNLKDHIIDFSIPYNRPDCLNILGLSREISLIHNTTFSIPKINPILSEIKDVLPIKIIDKNICPTYLGRIIKNVNTNFITPIWMQEKLKNSGMHPINLLTDIRNYIILELGHFISFFDYNSIKNAIIIRKASDKEKTELINNKINILKKNVLVISDEEKILEIIGSIENLSFFTQQKKTNLFLGCGFFIPSEDYINPECYKSKNNSIVQYKQEIDYHLQSYALEKASKLILSICGGQAKASPIFKKTYKKYLPLPKKIILFRKRLDSFIGKNLIKNEKINDILIRIGLKIISKDSKKWVIKIPSWRYDLSYEEDIIEEILRIYGYSNIPNIPIKTCLKIVNNDQSYNLLKNVKTLLTNKGFQEIITYSFISPLMQKLISPDQNILSLKNPISKDLSTMRCSLLYGLLSTVAYNQNRQIYNLYFFEHGYCFFPKDNQDLGVEQKFMLSAVITGERHEEHWDYKKKNVDFYDLKGILESIFQLLGHTKNIEFRRGNHQILIPDTSTNVYLANKNVGYIGLLHPILKNKLNLHGTIVVFELFINEILKRKKINKIHNISKYPFNSRDISVIVPYTILSMDIIKECEKSIKNLISINVFDVYYGEKIKKGYKSISLRITLQSFTHTLTEKDISQTINACVYNLKKKFNAFLRDKDITKL
ncbi:phenylalanine--tRNA ligase subunit beta [Candidatus Tachikawaea gelatinosa]|uniref:Phenylalanine--tRNA ligase beta subunit n=1 Tax=Candidatus Tachikawaea gelatinosa TaxID=1410383 RepID=A0A090ALJ3_9ENTR|nr:phenylalanine--tRNA ligase subunit beta [Candidatus Tachikawaea gelatinosa]BAP58514.1 phenylalanine--tRNA ligase beta subunit [Candidatus Tachikawaea gelatinosa]